jgi:hypothetical protein
MLHSRTLRVLVLIVVGVAGYRWLGFGVFFPALIIFMLWELLMPPRPYRKFGPGQIQQAVDNRFGIFGKDYREDGVPLNRHRRLGEMILVHVAADGSSSDAAGAIRSDPRHTDTKAKVFYGADKTTVGSAPNY